MTASRPTRRVFPSVLAVLAIAALFPPHVPAGEASAPVLASPTALLGAIQRGEDEVWPRLLAAGADVKARDDRGNTPLHFAALRGDAAAVFALLEHGADPAATNDAGATPLHYGTPSEAVVAVLLRAGAPPDPLSKIGATPLFAAVARNDSFAVVQRLIAAGADVNRQRGVVRGPEAQDSILAVAITAGDRRTVALLLEHGARVNPADGNSPLAAAAFVGDVGTARLLLEHGADVNYVSGFAGSALNFALHSRHDDIARLLMEHGADLNSRSTAGHGTPPMVWSAYNDEGDPTIARRLVDRGVDVNVANEVGETALTYALKRGADTPLVRFLREAGARPPPAPVRAKAIPSRDVPADTAARSTLVRDRAQRAIDLLQRNSTAFLENGFVHNVAKCVSCHQQALPAVAIGWARERGLRIDEHELGRQLHTTITQRTPQAENARQLDEPTPNAPVTLGFDADALHAVGYTPDEVTDAMSHYLLSVQHADGSWGAYVRRPPIEDGPLVGTAWSARALQLYPPAGREREVQAALGRARAWLRRQQVRSPNERVFQLLGLAWAGETPERMRPFADRLMASQRADGGWSQLPALPGDAWATGSALVALYKAGIAPSHAAYQRGVGFLLRTQFDDGSWWVRSRTWPFQPHFDGQFPHGKDQWISAAGTAWATMALLLTLEPSVPPESIPTAQALIAKFKSDSRDTVAATKPAPASSSSAPPAAPVVFARDISPLIKRSCAGCHVGEKVKGGLSLASRESLLEGGQSGEPAIVPGRSGESQLIRYVSDQIEDLEMPPLSRREKYPPLAADEVALVRTWIDAGAEWDDAR